MAEFTTTPTSKDSEEFTDIQKQEFRNGWGIAEADNEDIEEVDSKYKFKDRANYKIIRADFDFLNIPVGYDNSIWELRHDHNLSGGNLTIPAGVTLMPNGGSISNYGIITGNNTKIKPSLDKLFDTSGIFAGSWMVNKVNARLFGILDGSSTTSALQAAVNAAIVFKANKFICKGYNNLLISELDISNASKIKFDFSGTNMNADGNGTLSLSGNSPGVRIRIKDSSRVTFSGVNHDGKLTTGHFIGIEGCYKCKVSDITTKDTHGRGIISVNSDYTHIVDNEVSWCKTAYNGIVVGNNNTGFVDRDAIVENNLVHNCDATGIVFASIGGRVRGNKSHTNNGAGIITTGVLTGEVAKRVDITFNECYNNQFHGIQEDAASGTDDNEVFVAFNYCHNNRTYGIVNFRHNNWTIANNFCYDNGFGGGTTAGIRVEGGKSNTISNNQCYNKDTSQQKHGISIATQVLPIERINIDNNICNSNENGISVELTGGTGSIDGININGNTCMNNTAYGIFCTSNDVVNTYEGIVQGNMCLNNTNKDIRVSPRKLMLVNNCYGTDVDNGYLIINNEGATPPVHKRDKFRIINSSPQTITDFTNSYEGQVIYLTFTDGNSTLSGNFQFKDDTSTKIMANESAISLWRVLNKWREV